MAQRLKRNDEVVVITGAHKLRRGKILKIDLRREQVIVEGVNLRKKSVKARAKESMPEGGFEEKECPLHISNVMKVETFNARRQRQQGTAPTAAENS